MWSMKDMFYGEAEPVWILKPEKEDNKKAEKKSDSGSTGGSSGSSSSSSSKKGAERAADFYLSSSPYYPYDYPDYVPPPPTPRKVEAKVVTVVQPKKDTKVVLKVPICCGECVESIEAALCGLRGVQSVECDTRKERVTVIATTAAPADILVECRKVFRKSRFWTDNDY